MQEKNNKKPLLAQVLVDRFIESEISNEYDLSSQEVLILYYLANRIGSHDSCWPSQKKIERTRLSRATIQRSLKSLLGKNLIKIIKKWKSNCYVLMLPSGITQMLDSEIIMPQPEAREESSGITQMLDQASHRGTNNSIEELTKINNSNKKRKRRVSSIVEMPVVLPEWLDKQVWEQFVQHRKMLKSKMSTYAERLAINKLEKLRGEGFDVTDIIHTSIYNGWKGLFPPNNFIQKENQNGKPKKESLIEMHWRLNTQGIRKEPSSERDITPSESGAYKKDIYDF